MARELSLQELITSSFEHQMAGINTCIPGIIVSVDDLDSLSVSVQPTVNMKFKDGQVQEYPTITNVPLLMPSSSTSAVTFPVNVGDPVLIIFSMRGVDNFKAGNGRPAAPTDFRKFDLSDAFAIPAPWPKSKSINNPSKHVWDHSPKDMVMVHNLGGGSECEFRLKADGNIQIRTNQDVEVLGKSITVNATEGINLNSPTMTVDIDNTTWIGAINLQGNLVQVGNYTMTGIATFNGIVFNTHRHLGVTTGSGTSGGPTT